MTLQRILKTTSLSLSKLLPPTIDLVVISSNSIKTLSTLYALREIQLHQFPCQVIGNHKLFKLRAKRTAALLHERKSRLKSGGHVIKCLLVSVRTHGPRSAQLFWNPFMSFQFQSLHFNVQSSFDQFRRQDFHLLHSYRAITGQQLADMAAAQRVVRKNIWLRNASHSTNHKHFVSTADKFILLAKQFFCFFKDNC